MTPIPVACTCRRHRGPRVFRTCRADSMDSRAILWPDCAHQECSGHHARRDRGSTGGSNGRWSAAHRKDKGNSSRHLHIWSRYNRVSNCWECDPIVFLEEFMGCAVWVCISGYSACNTSDFPYCLWRNSVLQGFQSGLRWLASTLHQRCLMIGGLCYQVVFVRQMNLCIRTWLCRSTNLHKQRTKCQ
jgi:hypothetical protein